MARGWESKSVEEQQSQSSSTDQPDTSKPKPSGEDGNYSPEQRMKMAQRSSLELAIKRVRHDLASSSDTRRKQMLEAALTDLENKLRELD